LRKVRSLIDFDFTYDEVKDINVVYRKFMIQFCPSLFGASSIFSLFNFNQDIDISAFQMIVHSGADQIYGSSSKRLGVKSSFVIKSTEVFPLFHYFYGLQSLL
jgi:hypothetical protein